MSYTNARKILPDLDNKTEIQNGKRGLATLVANRLVADSCSYNSSVSLGELYTTLAFTRIAQENGKHNNAGSSSDLVVFDSLKHNDHDKNRNPQ